jgi:hypothetical protein
MKSILISESEKQRILEMHQNATSRQYLMEGVPNTTLTSDAGITVVSRTVCGSNDYIKVSFIVTNSGTEDAYLTRGPILTTTAGGLLGKTAEYNVTIGGKASWGQADGQNSPKIPKGKKATINCVIYTSLTNAKATQVYELGQAAAERNTTRKKTMTDAANKKYSDEVAKLTTLKSGTMGVRYNGVQLDVPITFGGFMVDASKACDAQIVLPKGY